MKNLGTHKFLYFLNRSGFSPVLKSRVIFHFKTDKRTCGNNKIQRLQRSHAKHNFFSHLRSLTTLFLFLPNKTFLSFLPLSSSPSPPPPEHHRHRNQSLLGRKGKTIQWIRKLKRAKDLFNINNTHCQCYHKISHNINI